jgi:hypothetical protein
VALMQREAATTGEISHPVAGSTAGHSIGLLDCCCDGFLSRLPARHVDKRHSRFEVGLCFWIHSLPPCHRKKGSPALWSA